MRRNIKTKNIRRGFSLIELVVYVGMFSMLSIVIVNSLMRTLSAFNDLRISRDINDSAVSVMERLTRDIRSATTIDFANSTFGSTPGMLTLTTLTASGTSMTVQYFMSANTIHVKENGVDIGTIVTSNTQVDALRFYYVNNGASTGIKSELYVTSARGNVSDSDHFYNTTVMRGTI